MIKYITPTGKREKETMKEALDDCKREAENEAEKTTGIFTSITSSEHIHITCNEKKWLIPLSRP